MLQDTSLLQVISQKPLRLENEGRAINVVPGILTLELRNYYVIVLSFLSFSIVLLSGTTAGVQIWISSTRSRNEHYDSYTIITGRAIRI